MSTRRKQITPTTTGKPTQKVSRYGIPLAPPDHKIYSQGWIIGQTFSGASPKSAPENPEPDQKPSSPEKDGQPSPRRSGPLPREKPKDGSKD